MTTFENVYTIVAKIPKGKVMTYGQVALLANTTPRVVGFAMHGNKDTKRVPCHRVVGKNGTLTGYARGGNKVKRQILKDEGIKFLNAQTVDLQKSLFKT
ncbi:MAG TPA: MGMT family protein, partial [Candidatus Saccharimonadales bacterium]|nr:MGMT family protein [Candidatus Saccharimonadales bacterium]